MASLLETSWPIFSYLARVYDYIVFEQDLEPALQLMRWCLSAAEEGHAMFERCLILSR